MNYITLPMIHASLQQVHAWGGSEIGARIAPVTQKLAEGAETLGFIVAAPAARSPHILTLRREQPIPADVVEKLEERNVWASSRGGGIRFSPYLFANQADIDRALNALEDISA